MPRDQRLYMTFPIDFHRHPKVSRLTDAAFRAFVEANGESRIAESDGRLEAPDAEFMWTPAVLQELVESHPSRPLMIREGDVYVLRDYAEHQFTKADRDDLSRKRAEAGAKGAAAKASKRLASAEQVPSKLEQTQAESESGIDDFSHVNESSPVLNAHETTDSDLPRAVQVLANQAGLTSVSAIVDQLQKHTGRDLEPDRAVGVAMWLLGKAKNPRVPQRYVHGAIARSPLEVQKYIDEAGLAS